MEIRDFDPELIKEALASQDHIKITDPSFTPSAVLVLIYPNSQNSYSLILEKRTNNLKKHSGEISFPGGKFEPEKDKDKVTTALRETYEEIGITPDSIEILGFLDEFPTLTGYIITPVVGIIKTEALSKIQFNRSKGEVQKILVIPIEFFLDPKNYSDSYVELDGEKFPIYVFNYFDKEGRRNTIWGATAHLLVQYLYTIYKYNPSKNDLKRFSRERILYLIKKRKEKLSSDIKANNLKFKKKSKEQ